MTGAEYRKMTLAQMQTKRWCTTRELKNGMLTIPAGMEVEITGKRGGLSLSGERCEHCGVMVHISRCYPGDVEEIMP